jgi:predicted transcriptional regulator of viral defense system
MNTSIHNQVLNKIINGKRGKIIFPSEFKEIASSEAIRQILSRLTKEGMLIRLAHGIYLSPIKDPVLGILHPSTDDIAQVVAQKDKVKIMPTGLNALNKLGISTQVPMKAVYLTNGRPKTIKAGKRIITFKTAAPKKLAAKGKISGMVIQALEELGKENITPDVLTRITNVLHKENKKIIVEDAKLAPEWIAQLLFSITKKLK